MRAGAAQVNVQKRETERQVENRTKSYAYMKETEGKEEWKKLKHHTPQSAEATVVWQALQQPVQQPLEFSLGPQKYLRLLTPGCQACFGPSPPDTLLSLCLSPCLGLHYPLLPPSLAGPLPKSGTWLGT